MHYVGKRSSHVTSLERNLKISISLLASFRRYCGTSYKIMTPKHSKQPVTKCADHQENLVNKHPPAEEHSQFAKSTSRKYTQSINFHKPQTSAIQRHPQSTNNHVCIHPQSENVRNLISIIRKHASTVCKHPYSAHIHYLSQSANIHDPQKSKIQTHPHNQQTWIF
jgi:hypothetical protein